MADLTAASMPAVDSTVVADSTEAAVDFTVVEASMVEAGTVADTAKRS